MDDEVQAALRKLGEVSKLTGDELEKFVKEMTKLGFSVKHVSELTEKTIKTQEDYRKKAAKTFDQQQVNIKNLTEQFRSGALSTEGLTSELESLRAQINRTSNAEQKAALIQQKAILEEINARHKSSEILKTSMGELTGTVIKGVANSFLKAGKDALSGSDGFKVAQGFMEAQVDVANSAAQVGSKALTSFGAATAGAGGKVGMLGVSASIAGAAVGLLSNTISELAKAGIGFMFMQVQKTITGFQTMNTSGAMFSGGMEEMRRTASASGLSLESFSKVVSANASRMADGGMSVSDAAKSLSSVGTVFDKVGKDGKTIRQNLLNLGYSFEEQAELSARVISDMNRGLPKGQRASSEEVATQTAKYAENLRLISNLTGEDAKAKAEKARAANAELAFEAEKVKMSKEQRAQLEVAMAGMTELEQQNLRERMVFGTVINQAGAIQEATVNGQREKGLRFEELLRKNQLTTESVADTNAKYAETISKSTLVNAESIGKAGMAGAGLARDMAKNQADSLKQARQYNAENLAETKKKLAEAKEGKGSEKITGAMRESQQLMIEMEKIATENLGLFAKAVEQTIKDVKSSVKDLAEFSTKASTMPTWLAPMIGVLTTVGTTILQYLVVQKAASVPGLPGGEAGAGKLGGSVGKGMEGIGAGADKLGKGIGGGLQGALRGLALGLASFSAPPVMLGMAVVAAGTYAMAKAFEAAGPAMEPFGKMLKSVFEGIGTVIESIGTSVSTVITGISNSLESMSKNVEIGRLYLLAPAIGAIGISLLPFAAGGALAGLVGKVGGFKSVTDGLRDFESINPDKLRSVADAMSKVTASLPSPMQLATMAAVGVIDKMTRSPSKETTPTPPLAAPTISSDTTSGSSQLLTEVKKMTELLIKQNTLAEEAMNVRKRLVDVTEDHKRTADRIFNATV